MEADENLTVRNYDYTLRLCTIFGLGNVGVQASNLVGPPRRFALVNSTAQAARAHPNVFRHFHLFTCKWKGTSASILKNGHAHPMFFFFFAIKTLGCNDVGQYALHLMTPVPLDR